MVALLIILISCCGGGAALLFGDDDGKDAAAPATTTAAATTPAQAAAVSPIEALRAQLSKDLGKSNREGMQRIAAVSIDKNDVVVRWAINDNLTTNLIRVGMQQDVHRILQRVRESNIDYNVVRLTGTFSMKDAYGNVTEAEVIRLAYTKPVVGNVNFANVDRKTLLTLADEEQFIHPEFRA